MLKQNKTKKIFLSVVIATSLISSCDNNINTLVTKDNSIISNNNSIKISGKIQFPQNKNTTFRNKLNSLLDLFTIKVINLKLLIT